jgi:hypothetical protein
MADPAAPLPTEPTVAVETVVAAPAVAEPAVAAHVDPAAVPVAEPVAAVAAVAEPSAEAKPHTETASLLEEAGAAPKAEPGAPEKPAEAVAQPLPTYEPFKLPEGVTADPAKMAAYTEVLGKHGITQEVGQELVGLHTAAIQDLAVHMAAEQHRAFADTRAEWREQIRSDERMGGSAFQTTQAAVARMRDMFVPEADRAGFNEFLRVTGAGDHPAFWRLLHNAARHFDEPSLPPPSPKPPADIGRNPAKGGRRSLYDHPSSTRVQ